MRQASRIVGHENRRESLKQLVLSGKLPSTMMFAGPPGTGKLLVAKELCRTLICRQNSLSSDQRQQGKVEFVYGGCGICKSCHTFEAGNYPDFHLVQCLDKETSKVEKLRELLYSLNLSSFSGGARLVIFDNAEHLSIQASNILLKTLEEPRPDTWFILVTASPSKILPTIQSRSQIWFFDTLKEAQVKEILNEKIERDPKGPLASIPKEELALLCDGSLDGAETIASHYELWETIKEKLRTIAHGDISLAIDFSAQIAKDKEAVHTYLQLMRIFAREMMKKSSDDDSMARWALFLSNIVASEKYIADRNLSITNVLNTALLSLVSSRHLKSFTRMPNSASLLEKICV